LRGAASRCDPGFFARLERGRPILIPGDGFPFVHLIHIDDVARMLVALIGNDRVRGEAYNAA
jgi:nucleoside-diphosphate-sugar epimerase